MAITYNPEEYIAALGDLTPLVRDEMGGMQGVDILNQFAGGGGSYNIPNGGFVRPVATTDPTYRSGYDYARSIAGGMPMSQVIAPGVSYSPEQPGGYTQADLNIAAGITPPPPPPPPVYQQPDDPSFFGTGIGGVTIPGGRRDKMPPLRNIFGDMPTTVPPVQAPPVQTPPIQVPPQEFNIEQIRQDIADSGIDFTNLFGLPQAPDLSQFVTKDDLPNGRDFSIENLDLPDFNEFALRKDLPVYQEPDLSQFVTKQDLPSLIPDVPNGRDFSIENLDLPDFSEFALRKDLPVYQEPDLSGFARIEDLPTFNPDELRKDILMSIPTYEQQDLSGFARIEDLPTVPTFDRESLIRDIRSGIDIPKPPSIDRQSLIEDIRSGIELPSYQAPDLSGFARIEDLPTFNPDELRQDILMSLPEQKMQDLSGFVTQADINKAISGINMPTYEQPDLSAYDTRLAELEQSLAALQQPTGGRFSINQPQVRGLF